MTRSASSHALGPVARDAVHRLAADHLDRAEAERGDGGAQRQQADRSPHRPVAGGERERQRHEQQRGHARLRVGEEQPGPHQRQGGEQGQVTRAAGGQQREHDPDAQHHVAAVEARVAEQGRHAEEVRVRVRDGEVRRVEEQLVGDRLPDPHGGEHRRQRDRADGQHARGPVGELGTRDHGQQRRERQREEREHVRPGLDVVGPQQRQEGEAEEGGGGQRQHSRQLADLRAAERPPAERQPRGGQDEVERQQAAQAPVLRDRHEEAVRPREVERRPERGGEQDGHRNQRRAP